MTRRTPDNTPKNPLTWLLDRLMGPSPASGRDPAGLPGSPAPARLGHYAIERKLGEGGMGVVYVARDERLHRTVALKTISSLAANEDDTARQRFWREAAKSSIAISSRPTCS